MSANIETCFNIDRYKLIINQKINEMKSLVFCFLLLSIMFLGCKEKSDWTKWRGTKGDGISTETAWSPNKLDSSNILWTKNIGFGHSAIAVKGDKCYASGWKGDVSEVKANTQATIYCFDIKSGSEVWRFNYPSALRNFPGPRSTPVIDGDLLYAISWDGKLYNINAQNGKENWMVDLTADSLSGTDPWGYCQSPVIYKNLILLNLNKSGIALDKNSGKVVWKSDFGWASYASVQFVNFEGKTAGVFISDKKINLVNPLTGNVLLSYEKKSRKGINNDIMITGDGNLFSSNELLEFSGDSLKSLWINDSIASTFRTGLVLSNFAYQFSDNRNRGNFYCVDLKTGIPVWSSDMGAFGSVIAVNNKLIIITGKGKVVIADAKPDKFNLLKELQLFTFDEKSNNWCWTAPTFLDGKLYVRNSFGDMACIDLGI
jgi:outer membrane protein assembly factor BamB